MTDRRAQIARSKRRSSMAVYAVSAALFATVAGALGVQMAQGQDPAIGPKKAQVATVQPRKVLVRKVVVTRRIVVIEPAPSATPPASSPSGQASAPAPASSAPAQTAAPAPAPAPTPAPAPVATATS